VKKKKQTICPRCKKPVPAKTAFCDVCGARVTHPPSCSLCGTLLAPGSRFCPSCGTPVPQETDTLNVHYGSSARQSPIPEIPSDENSASLKQENPGSAEGFQKQKDPDIPDSSSPVDAIIKLTRKRKSRSQKRSAVTILAETEPQGSPLFTRIPFGAIHSHKYLIFIIVAAIVIAGLFFTGTIRSPTLLATGTGISPPAEEVQSALVSSTVNNTGMDATLSTVATPIINLEPGPTEIPPDNLLVYFQAERDPTTRIVSVQFMGGKGQAGVRDVLVRLTRSDGQVLTGTFKPLQVGSGVELQGTEKLDRVEVIVHYYSGDPYTVIDRAFEWKKQL
jgi:RNA polymerase subunit RPABC4/transcription elongation factor Spt4